MSNIDPATVDAIGRTFQIPTKPKLLIQLKEQQKSHN
jgi:hypothetical protein